MSLDTRAMAALWRRQKRARGRTVTYTRAGVSVSFTAWPGDQMFARAPTSSNAATVEWSEADYLFTVADAKAAGLTLPPQKGDRITDPLVLDDRTGSPKVFELRTPTGETCWRYCDQDETTARVHCTRAG